MEVPYDGHEHLTPGNTVSAGFSLPPLALSKILDTWRPPCVAFTSG
jgi:hypothetical protein